MDKKLQENLISLLEDASSLSDAFNVLKGEEMAVNISLLQYQSLKEIKPLEILLAQREYAVMCRCKSSRETYIHPYGTAIAYKLYTKPKKQKDEESLERESE